MLLFLAVARRVICFYNTWECGVSNYSTSHDDDRVMKQSDTVRQIDKRVEIHDCGVSTLEDLFIFVRCYKMKVVPNRYGQELPSSSWNILLNKVSRIFLISVISMVSRFQSPSVLSVCVWVNVIQSVRVKAMDLGLRWLKDSLRISGYSKKSDLVRRAWVLVTFYCCCKIT